MRVLFLDIDGVLNSTHWENHRKKYNNGMLRPPSEHWYPNEPDHIRRKLWDLDPMAISTLKRIIIDYDFKVVISSGDRVGESIEHFEKLFNLRDGSFPPGRIIGMTPSMGLEATRGDEIEAWLQSAEPCQYIIIDDRSDFHHYQKSHLIQTERQIGLQPWHHEIAGLHLEKDADQA
jgi:hypothetical protein